MISTTLAQRRRSAEQVAAPLEWAGWIIRPTDPKYPGINHVPNSCGIYAWYSRGGDLLYVGRSNAMNSRLRRHHMPGWGGVLLSYRLVPEQYLAGVEMAHIETLDPLENAAMEAASVPFWDQMCSAIDAAWRDVLPAMNERTRARQTAIIEQIAARL